MTTDQDQTTEELVQLAAELCFEKRAEDIVALDVRGLVDYMDFLLIVSGRSARQNRAIAENLIRGVKKAGVLPLSRSGIEFGSWICIDLVDVVVHIFDLETREHYDLELLWADAEAYELDLPTAPVAAPEDDEPYEEGVIEPPRD